MTNPRNQVAALAKIRYKAWFHGSERCQPETANLFPASVCLRQRLTIGGTAHPPTSRPQRCCDVMLAWPIMITTASAVKADNVNRTLDQPDDTTIVLEQYNQIAPENDLKRRLFHPRAGAEGYDFGRADAFVNLGSPMECVSDTLVGTGRHQWVFAGTSPPPALPNTIANGKCCHQ